MSNTVKVGDKNLSFSFSRKDGTPLNIKELPRSNYALAFKLDDGTTTHMPLTLMPDNVTLMCPEVIPDYAVQVQVVLSWNDGNNVLMGPTLRVVGRIIH